jgi:hypothetical protein
VVWQAVAAGGLIISLILVDIFLCVFWWWWVGVEGVESKNGVWKGGRELT